MGNKMQKEKMEREAASKGLSTGASTQAAGSAHASANAKAEPAASAVSDADYSNYNNKLSINDFALLKVRTFILFN
jgi:hypothetical protein